MQPTQRVSEATLPSTVDIAAEWRRRAGRPGLARVMRQSQPGALAADVTDRTRALVADHLDVVAGRLRRPLRSALEIGCGIGRITPTIAEHAERVTAIDMTEAMLAAATDSCAGLSNVEFHRLAAQQLPAFAPMDVAVSIWVLMHVLDDTEIERVCQGIARSASHLVLIEYEHAGIPVGRYSRLRSLDEYVALLPGASVVARRDLFYGGDLSFAALIDLRPAR